MVDQDSVIQKKTNAGGVRSNALLRKRGIIVSTAVHCFILSLLVVAPAAQILPATEPIIVTLVQNAPAPAVQHKKRKGTVASIKKPVPKESRNIIIPSSQGEPRRVEEAAPMQAGQKPVPELLTAGDLKPETETLQGIKTSVGGANLFSEASGAPSSEPQYGGNAGIQEGTFGDIDAPAFIHRELPDYPRLAQRLGKEGKVVLKLLIDMQGKLQDIEVVESPWLGFTEAAVEAIKKSSFSPGRRNGKLVPSKATLCIRFHLK
ncbi:MAG: energy transducer TonB [Deltaproteobacteria bacterium]|nr:energy transducer TonB [Deltaproteobacteria bacterium]